MALSLSYFSILCQCTENKLTPNEICANWKREARKSLALRTMIVLGITNGETLSILTLISERHPWHKNGTLKFVSPCAYITAIHIWFQARFWGLFSKNMADSQVQKSNYMAYCFEKKRIKPLELRNKVVTEIHSKIFHRKSNPVW